MPEGLPDGIAKHIEPLFYQKTLDVVINTSMRLELDCRLLSHRWFQVYLCLFSHLPNQVLLQIMAAKEHPSLKAATLQL